MSQTLDILNYEFWILNSPSEHGNTWWINSNMWLLDFTKFGQSWELFVEYSYLHFSYSSLDQSFLQPLTGYDYPSGYTIKIKLICILTKDGDQVLISKSTIQEFPAFCRKYIKFSGYIWLTDFFFLQKSLSKELPHIQFL